MTGDMIDASDIPPLSELFFATAKRWIPKKARRKEPITLDVDADVLKWDKPRAGYGSLLITTGLV